MDQDLRRRLLLIFMLCKQCNLIGRYCAAVSCSNSVYSLRQTHVCAPRQPSILLLTWLNLIRIMNLRRTIEQGPITQGDTCSEAASNDVLKRYRNTHSSAGHRHISWKSSQGYLVLLTKGCLWAKYSETARYEERRCSASADLENAGSGSCLVLVHWLVPVLHQHHD